MSTPTHPNQPASETLPVANSETPSNQSRPQQVQAAHLSDKVPTDVPLAEGTEPPRPPTDNTPQTHRPSKPELKFRRRKKTTNQFDFRADDETADRIYRRVEQAGCKTSEAIRQLIEDGDTLVTRIIISPRTPPQELEAYLGALRGWRNDFLAVRSRLNAPMPQKPEDADLTQQVRKWRKIAETLHEKINELIPSAEATLLLMTRLTPDRISRLRQRYPDFVSLAKIRAEKAKSSENPAEKKKHEYMSVIFRTIAELIEDLGLVEPVA